MKLLALFVLLCAGLQSAFSQTKTAYFFKNSIIMETADSVITKFTIDSTDNVFSYNYNGMKVFLEPDSLDKFEDNFIDFFSSRYARQLTTNARIDIAQVYFILNSKGKMTEKGITKLTRNEFANKKTLELLDLFVTNELFVPYFNKKPVDAMYFITLDFASPQFSR